MTSAPAPNLVQPPMPPADDEIDLRQVAAALGRQKKLIAAVAGAAAAERPLRLTRKPVWEGQFQIVLENGFVFPHGKLLQQSTSPTCSGGGGGTNWKRK